MDLVKRLSYLFGTEETVQRRRQLVLLRERIRTSLQRVCVICSGSLGEGVAFPSSDDDLMYVDFQQSSTVYESYEEAIQHRALYMIPSHISPGFCLIQDTSYITLGFVLVSSRVFREDFAQSILGRYLHGPCASETVGPVEYDHAMCFSSPYWPTMANEWILRRRRYGWPSRALVENISRKGCHFVPIGNPDSHLCNFEWRISFSSAERTLIHEFNHVQFLVYNLLKLILKRVISSRIPDVLCSYFLKTVLFYTIENSSPEIWVNDAVNECYKKSLLILYHFIDTKNCPNYFVPENNMMRRKVNESNKLPLLDIVRELMIRGIAGSLLLCGTELIALNLLLSPKYVECRNDDSLLSGYHLITFMRECKEFILQDVLCRTSDVANVLSTIFGSDLYEPRSRYSDFFNLIFKYVFSVLGYQNITKSSSATGRNACRYQTLKCGQAMLKIGCNTDVSSGRLKMANYMFMSGRFRQCLAIIQKGLSKVAPFVLYYPISKATIEMYVQAICNKGYSLEYKLREAWALDIKFIAKGAEFAPLSVKIFFALIRSFTMESYCFQVQLHPLCFAYYLQGLCFYHTSDFDSMCNSAALLKNIVTELRRDEVHAHYIVFSRLLLSHIVMLLHLDERLR